MWCLAETPRYIVHIHEELTTDVYPTGIRAGSTRLFLDTKGRCVLLGRTPDGGNLRLWELCPQHAFEPVREYVINNTASFEACVVHILCPARFAGESDKNRIQILCSRVPKNEDGKDREYAELWYTEFDLPST